MTDYRQRMDDLREQGEARNADRAMAPLEARIAELEAALREIAGLVIANEIQQTDEELARECESKAFLARNIARRVLGMSGNYIL